MADHTVWLSNDRLSPAYYTLNDDQFDYVNGGTNDAERAARAVECFENPDGAPPTAAPADKPADNPDPFGLGTTPTS